MVNQKQSGDDFSQVSWVIVSEHQQGQRIDNFLFRHLKGVPKSRVYRILRKGEVRVNKSRTKPEYKLQNGDKIRIPPIRVSGSSTQEFEVPGWVRNAIKQPIFEDEALIVINKPSGLAVHGGSGVAFGLIEAMRQLEPDRPFLELAHRIDRETSGCIVLAKSRQVLNQLHEQFRREQGKMEKSYLAIISGDLQQVTSVNSALRQTRDTKGMKRVVVDSQGQAARSTFMPLESFQQASYARVLLYTGRMHQARAHADSIDLPILGDKLYGNWDVNRRVRVMGVKRCMLHAERYQLDHPLSGNLLRLDAPLPVDFKDVLENFRRGIELEN